MYLPSLEKHFKNACAISNAFFLPLATEGSDWRPRAELRISQVQKSNNLAERVRSEHWLTRKANWRNVDEALLFSFPRLTQEDLKLLTLGTYQLELAKEYTNQHMKQKTPYEIQVHIEDEENIVRAKIGSRMSKQTTHTGWIEFTLFSAGPCNIEVFCCTCKVGARMIGMCSLLCSVIWYLSYARHQDFTPPSYSLADNILNAAEIITETSPALNSSEEFDPHSIGEFYYCFPYRLFLMTN